MKKPIVTLIILCLTLAVTHATPSITNSVCLDSTIQAKLAGIVLSFPDQLVKEEGRDSNPYSSIRGEADYFLIRTPLNVRLLEMIPFTTSNFRPWYGVEETNVTFVDVVSKEMFRAPLVTPEERGEHRTTITIDGMDVYVYVGYWATPRYPFTTLSWGHSSTYRDVGLELDEFNCTTPVVGDAPENRIVEIRGLHDQKGLFGVSVILVRPLHTKHVLQYAPTVDGQWVSVARSELLLDSTGTRLFYQTGSKEQIFLRLLIQ